MQRQKLWEGEGGEGFELGLSAVVVVAAVVVARVDIKTDMEFSIFTHTHTYRECVRHGLRNG